jgi:hypothetical protein
MLQNFVTQSLLPMAVGMASSAIWVNSIGRLVAFLRIPYAFEMHVLDASRFKRRGEGAFCEPGTMRDREFSHVD